MLAPALTRLAHVPRPGARTVASALLLVLVALIILDIFRAKSGASGH